MFNPKEAEKFKKLNEKENGVSSKAAATISPNRAEQITVDFLTKQGA